MKECEKLLDAWVSCRCTKKYKKWVDGLKAADRVKSLGDLIDRALEHYSRTKYPGYRRPPSRTR